MILIDILLLALWLYGLYLSSQSLTFGYVLTLTVPVAWIIYEVSEGRYGLVIMVVAVGSTYALGVACWLKRKHSRRPKPPRKLYFVDEDGAIHWEYLSSDGKLIHASRDFYSPKIAAIDAVFSLEGDFSQDDRDLHIIGKQEVVDQFYLESVRLREDRKDL
ncbi:gp088 [Rhodococcus phage ReqiPepy6]|uniref:Gp088 n=1 Tax=Rhodococcus phage ReqiPepy6 TaxID=691965 RepID=D4P7J9_9CAUD|nr:gp088 [Rhodococcus phage ReqiPepy6]ADD80979.1 gp088 [Rhodococcus phage ReqiPepy6]